MPKFQVTRTAFGYVRGTQTFEVEAHNPKEAVALWWEGTLTDEVIIRDDREGEDYEVTEILLKHHE